MKGPLQSSSGHNAAAGGGDGKTIEEMYQKKTQLEHILLRPDTYIGSVEKHTQTLWVYEGGAMAHRSVTYVPGLYKIFDEILVNAADNKQRDPKMDALRVDIDVAGCCISVYNNGDGIPVEVHQEEGVYVPEMIFGHLLTSSNYDDNVKKTTGGRNGYGAKLTNIFSMEFVIETADGRRQKKYKQVFSENMGKKSEPQITKCKQTENWTKVTFKPDLAKFNMTHLEDDVVALMRKRVIDMAGTLGKTVKVELDGQRVPAKSFSDYVNLYITSASIDRPEELPRIYEKVNDRWEVCVSLSEGQFQQVSFVNRIATIRGGTHVDYVTNQIATHVMTIVNKKNKNANMKLHNVKSHLWVFVNALIDNPAFDSQTKETLTTRQGSFGSKCELSNDFLKKVEKSGVVSNLLSWADFKLSKELKKTDGTKRSRISGIPKLEDANEAGGKDSDRCTLILTEGDSAKALAMSGIAEVGRDHYGVFPLRGKLLNVREANHKQIMDNAEIQNIKQILGLQHGKQYDSTKGLRYGHLMIMTDQDHDGSHIKGLLINFIHSFWPSLLKVPSFLVEFITPIIKATNTRNKTVLAFYTMPEYEAWKESLGGNAGVWSVKYYKGLGTSTSKEGQQYFKDIAKHKKDFVWVDDQDGNDIELAFSKKRITDRKDWLTNFQPGTYLDQRENQIKYRDFINKELILFSMADLQRSIPSMVDGFKPGQRKIMFCSFKRNFVKEAKVAQFSGYVSEHSAYHHGEQSLASTIIGMAQSFVGSNNINLLHPQGQFGTRFQGGKDAASPRYIFTKLSHITRSIFPKDDDILLNYLNEDGQSIEPTWYVPIIPVVLVNGSEGIGTGWSTYIPNYNPRDIVANLRRLLNDECTEPMHPWYRGFKGSIEKTNTKAAGVTYTITGIIEAVDNTTLRITELPVRRWTQDYKEFLASLAPEDKNKDKEIFIEDFTMQGDNEDVYFEVKLSEANMNIAKEEGLTKKFKLTTTIGTTNMHLFDADGKIQKYDNPEQILKAFFKLRLEFYDKRKKALLENIKLDLKKLNNKVRFIRCVVEDEIEVKNRKRAELFVELQQKNFDPFPKKKKAAEPAAVGATEEEDENEESSEAAKGIALASDYEYLLSMAIGTLTREKIQELNDEKAKLENEVEELRKTSPRSLWLRDLDAFEKELDVLDQMDEAEAEERKVRREEKANEEKGKKKGSKPGTKRQPKKTAAKPPKVESGTSDTPGNTAEQVVAKRGATWNKPTKKAHGAGSDDEDYGPENAKPGPQKKKQSKKASAPASDDEEDDVPALKDRLAAFNIDDSSPDHSAMDTETTEGQQNENKGRKGPSKRGASKKASSSLAVISSDDDDFDMEEVSEVQNLKKGRGRKPTAAEKPKAATTRKRAPAQGKSMIQKVIQEEESNTSAPSPEKKVRKMRASPFNKKSSSVLQRGATASSTSSESTSETSPSGSSAEPVAAPQPRRTARTTKKTTVYISESDDPEDEVVELTDDSDFDLDDNSDDE
ncbi:DNA topoisomerase 2-like [Phragmites australis]|uniref:DNA topoisomerase 2-like n=1 Tax=Phragmites australis TaxID=29695 RepID=UPI002D7975D9|nr:DNA topoisomerase 2-like [Phragmites australis]